MPTRALEQLYRVNDRFRRAANVAADYRQGDALRGYVVTPLVRRVLARIGEGLAGQDGPRAWSITGPYGSGKSACAVFLCQTLGYRPAPQGRKLLQEVDSAAERELLRRLPELAQGGYVVAPVVGSRQPLAWTLLDGLAQAIAGLEQEGPGLAEQRSKLQDLYARARAGEPVTPLDVAHAVERTAKLLRAELPGAAGLLIIYDELGKTLEYAALNPESTDIGLLQILAEMADRSADPRIALVTILHQDFDHYAALLSTVQRREWEKVQGRFRDIAFLQSSGELLGLVGRAIQPVSPDERLQAVAEEEAARAVELGLLSRDLARDNAKGLLARCAPLHPSVALVLGKLFRSRLAQNERSLFAFLSSGEPHGFQDFLASETWQANGDRPFYRLDHLYDYVQAALGSGLYAHAQGKRWAEIEEALARLPADAEPIEARLVKVIGMLGLLGDQRHLRASGDVLGYALADGRIGPEDVARALERLVRRGIAIYRRFNDAYALWQGSDVDLDECYERGRARIPRADLAALLARSEHLRPYVAKRHLHETGTLRYFAPWVVDLQDLATVAERDFGEADGAVVFVMPAAGVSPEAALRRVQAFSDALPAPRREQLFFAIPRNLHGIREGFEELAAWKWVSENIAELEGDSVARRELRGRQLAARERLGRAISRCFDLAAAHVSSQWVWKGNVLHLTSARQLALLLSEACDRVFHSSPIVRNELINRQSLSSAAAAARRSLIERLLDHGHEAALGLEGYPPEMSMYLSVLKVSGLHHEEGEGWAFGPSHAGDPCRVQPLWDEIDRFLAQSEAAPRPVTALYAVLRQPPFGIKEGLLPVYLAVALLRWRTEIAVYEEGGFVPQMRIAEWERLLRAPERFALQRYLLNNSRSRVLLGYARLFRPDVEPGSVQPLTCVRLLMGFASQLPRHTQLTDRLSHEAQAVRRALLTAREPQGLLFEQLPQALEISSLDDEVVVDNYLQRLRAVVGELHHAYNKLRERVQGQLLAALRLPGDLSLARQEIRQRASLIEGTVADMRLRAFLFRLRDEQLADREWVESVAALVANKPPRNWTDVDAEGFGPALEELAASLRRAEEMALARGGGTAGARTLRLGITDDTGTERSDLLRIRPGEEADVECALSALEETLRALPVSPRTRLNALALLALRMLEPGASGEEEHD
ncbi:MAG: hypothetical protein ACUVX9_03370 [Anaerolineae bacterium]